jgi:hypothetical protein
MRITLLTTLTLDIWKKTAEMPPKGKGKKVRKTVLTTPTEVEVPFETTEDPCYRMGVKQQLQSHF